MNVEQEEELRASGDPKFQHLSEELHVEISAFATPAEAHARIAYALAEVRRFLVPVSGILFELYSIWTKCNRCVCKYILFQIVCHIKSNISL